MSVPSATEQPGSSAAPESSKFKDADKSIPIAESRQSFVSQPPFEIQRTPSISSAPPTIAPPTTDTTGALAAPNQPSNQASLNPYAPLAATYVPSTSTLPAKPTSSKLLSQLYPHGAPALTYDSFWSSHTGTNSQKLQKPILGVSNKSTSFRTAGETPAAINANRPSANLAELPTAPPYPAVGESRREQGNPA
ncbi:hypothetical protein BJ165DRAFT_1405452 [Panaeolus papilionaceus]|nr:hypothetical protein BJ165DRAFT_1405452 [Panaeolus papilionaceus]